MGAGQFWGKLGGYKLESAGGELVCTACVRVRACVENSNASLVLSDHPKLPLLTSIKSIEKRSEVSVVIPLLRTIWNLYFSSVISWWCGSHGCVSLFSSLMF